MSTGGPDTAPAIAPGETHGFALQHAARLLGDRPPGLDARASPTR